MIINNIPTKVKGWTSSEVMFSKKDGFKKAISLMIIHNIPTIGSINSIEAAVTNWLFRTNKVDDKSLVGYINSKTLMSGHEAYTVKDFCKKFDVVI